MNLIERITNIPWSDIWDDIIDVLLWFPRKTFELLMDGLTALINAIPVPDFITNMPSAGQSLVAIDGITWAFYLFRLEEGIGILIGAYVLRFLIRRTPLVG